MSDTKFPQGMRLYPPHKNAPSFVKGQVVINVMELYEWMKLNWNEKREVRLDLKEGKSGALYFSLNTWKKEEQEAPSDDPAAAIPF